MSPDALWTQGTGATFSAAEDRKALAALSTAGISTGLGITSAGGRQVSVAAGAAFVDDGTGGRYVAYMDTATVLTMPASLTQNIYLVVDDPGTGGTTVITSASAPSDPYLVLGSVTCSASAVTTISATGATATPPSMAGAGNKASVPLTGGTMTGQLIGPRFTSGSVFDAFGGSGGGYVTMPFGARLGTSLAFGPNYAKAYMSPSTITQGVGSLVQTTVQMNLIGPWKSVHGGNPYFPDYFTCQVKGVYSFTGQVTWLSLGPEAGCFRRAAFIRYAGGVGSGVESLVDVRTPSNTPGNNVSRVSGDMFCEAGDEIRFAVTHNQGTQQTISAASAIFRLAMPW